MTVANDTRRKSYKPTRSKPPDPPIVPLVPKRPPLFAMGATVVLKGYEDGWRWTVVDAELLNRRHPFWSYTVTAVRPYDGKTVKCAWPEWRLRVAPVEAQG